MTAALPEYLAIPADQLGRDAGVAVDIVPGAAGIADAMARAMLEAIQSARDAGHAATLIIPVGPVDQFPLLAHQINQQHIDCRDVMLINMDEYLTDDDQWVERTHPLSFRGYMDRKFYDLVDPELVPSEAHRVFPHPDRCDELARVIARRGGVDVCFGGIGINGHIAFNEPLEPDESIGAAEFANRPTRVLSLTRETRTINAVTVGGEVLIVPRRAVTVGMREILAARRLCFYCNRPWQRGVVRRVLHGPITAQCPASLLRTHDQASITVADFVAATPDIQLR